MTPYNSNNANYLQIKRREYREKKNILTDA